MKYYDVDHKFDNQNPFQPIVETEITVVDDDTFGAASKETQRCGCLNFASHKRPGGGYKSVIDIPMPIKTQEEDLFRRSGLPGLMDTEDVRKHYPLYRTQGLYCRTTVFKDKQLNPCELFEAGIITVPAVVMANRIVGEQDDYSLPAAKIRRILEIAEDNDERILILGAWGCGVFHNDPKTIAELFKAELEDEFKGAFDKVIFAIPGEKSNNHQVFKDVLDQVH